jgi:hypothetical protein
MNLHLIFYRNQIFLLFYEYQENQWIFLSTNLTKVNSFYDLNYFEFKFTEKINEGLKTKKKSQIK